MIMNNVMDDINKIISAKVFHQQDFILKYIDKEGKEWEIKEYLDGNFDCNYYYNLLIKFGFIYVILYKDDIPSDAILEFLNTNQFKSLNNNHYKIVDIRDCDSEIIMGWYRYDLIKSMK